MAIPSLAEIRAQGFGAWDDPVKVKDAHIQICLNRVLPLYAGITNALDYHDLLMYHAGHYLELAMAWLAKQLKNLGQVGDITSASAGEVSVSFGLVAVNPVDPGSYLLTNCGQALLPLRKANGPFTAGGNPAVPWRPRY